jgi:hypothetical protein
MTLKLIDCGPYSARMSELACAKRHAASYASRHVTSTVRHVGTYALCHECIDGRDRMQDLKLVPVERMVRGVKLTRSDSMTRPGAR